MSRYVYGRRVGAVYIVAPFWYEDRPNSIPYFTIILFMYTPFNMYIASKQFRAHEIQMHIKDRIDRVPTPPLAHLPPLKILPDIIQNKHNYCNTRRGNIFRPTKFT